MRDQEKPLRSPSWRSQGTQKQNKNAVQSHYRVEPRRALLIRVRSSMRDQDLNERPGEAPLQSKLENPGETKTKQKRSPSTHRVEPRKVFLIRVRSSTHRVRPRANSVLCSIVHSSLQYNTIHYNIMLYTVQ